jgi:hypothetical protein
MEDLVVQDEEGEGTWIPDKPCGLSRMTKWMGWKLDSRFRGSDGPVQE